MRICAGILIFSLFYFGLSAQSAEDEVIMLKGAAGTKASKEEVQPDLAKEKAISGSWNFSVGTQFSYMKGYGSGMGFYAAPAYTLPVTNRFSLHGGLMASSFTTLNAPAQPVELQNPVTFSSLALFAAASYRMSDRLIVHGSGTKQLISAPVTPLTPNAMDNISLGATYHIGRSITIGASVHMVQGIGYYYGSPFQGAAFGSPFGW